MLTNRSFYDDDDLPLSQMNSPSLKMANSVPFITFFSKVCRYHTNFPTKPLCIYDFSYFYKSCHSISSLKESFYNNLLVSSVTNINRQYIDQGCNSFYHGYAIPSESYTSNLISKCFSMIILLLINLSSFGNFVYAAVHASLLFHAVTYTTCAVTSYNSMVQIIDHFFHDTFPQNPFSAVIIPQPFFSLYLDEFLQNFKKLVRELLQRILPSESIVIKV